MPVRVSIHLDRELAWYRDCLTDQPCGMTSEAYHLDGTQDRIVAALSEALHQAEGELGRPSITDVGADICPPAAKINDGVPISRVRHSNVCGEHLGEAAIKFVLPATPIVLKVRIIHYEHVALMRAVNDNNVARI